VLVVVALLAARPVRADPSERSDLDRVWHFSPVLLGGASYLIVEFALKQQISRDGCWWCEPPRLDARARSLRWRNVDRAHAVSNVTGFVLSPLFAMGGLTMSTAFTDKDARRVYDDIIPVVQAGVAAGLINEVLKIAVARKRPYARFNGKSVMQRPGESYTSFFSGHAALVFAMATSSGTVASLRGYESAPILWGGGLAIAVGTSYLRIASDTHYLTDVLFGAGLGAALGIVIPRVFHREVLTDEAVMAKPAAARPVMFTIGTQF
jgi:membrane-associated phospholipid phosphatase